MTPHEFVQAWSAITGEVFRIVPPYVHADAKLAAEAGFKRDVFYSAHRRLEKDVRIMDTHGNKSPENCWKAI